MNVLPDYLIEFMPGIEEAIEELRLSVLDHAYDMLLCLDVDELTSDEVRNKLELYDIKAENMTEEWMPNGRFYRMYPSIKHHRTRLNALQSVIKSGGQFEGLWSNDFNKKSEYNFKYIQATRHYSEKSPVDGYFYISGDVSRNSDGSVSSSSVTALSSDVLINQAMPAGYTYLYVPWPRPHYPSDSTTFYNVNALNVDRLHYAISCDEPGTSLWKKYIDGLGFRNVYICRSNSIINKYYNALTCKYGSSSIPSECVNDFNPYYNEGDIDSTKDHPYTYYGLDVPISKYYNYEEGKGTPYGLAYWYDYHYMGDLDHKTQSIEITKNNYEVKSVSWPIEEYGTYYDQSGSIVEDQREASVYTLHNYCSELNNSNATFPTGCFMLNNNKYNDPDRNYESSTFVNKGLFDIVSLNQNCVEIRRDRNITWNEAYSKYLQAISSGSKIKIESVIDYSDYDPLEMSTLENLSNEDKILNGVFGTYRHDSLSPSNFFLKEKLGHANYKADSIKLFWSYAPVHTIFSMVSNDPEADESTAKTYQSLRLNSVDESPVSLNTWLISTTPRYALHALLQLRSGDIIYYDPLYKWMFTLAEDSDSVYDEFTENESPELSRLNTTYAAFFAGPNSGEQGDNKDVSSSVSGNTLHNFNLSDGTDNPYYTYYNPVNSYTIVGLGSYVDNPYYPDPSSFENTQIVNSYNRVYIEGDLESNHLMLNKNNYPGDISANYVLYRMSDEHCLWFASDKRDVVVDALINKLYNYEGSCDNIYYCDGIHNTKKLVYTITGVYTSDGVPVSWVPDNYNFAYYFADGKAFMPLLVVKEVTRPVSYVEETDATFTYNLNNSGELGGWEEVTSGIPSGLSNNSDYIVFKSRNNKVDHITTTTITKTSRAEYYIYSNGWTTIDYSDRDYLPSTDYSKYVIYKSTNHDHNTESSITFRVNISITQQNESLSGDIVLPIMLTQSSEYNYDYIRIYVDGVYDDSSDRATRSTYGLYNEWRTFNIPLSTSGSPHTIELKYQKDVSVHNGSDCGYIALPIDEIINGWHNYRYNSVTNTWRYDKDDIIEIEAIEEIPEYSEMSISVSTLYDGEDSDRVDSLVLDGFIKVSDGVEIDGVKKTSTWSNFTGTVNQTQYKTYNFKFKQPAVDSPTRGYVAVHKELTGSANTNINNSYYTSSSPERKQYLIVPETYNSSIVAKLPSSTVTEPVATEPFTASYIKFKVAVENTPANTIVTEGNTINGDLFIGVASLSIVSNSVGTPIYLIIDDN